MTTVAADPGGVSFRRAERADLLEIARIERESFPQPWPFHAFEDFLGEPGFLVAVADRTGDIGAAPVIGYVVADTVPGGKRPVGHVKDLAVRAGWRERGIGTRLVERALAVLVATGAPQAKLEVRRSNDGAISLYQRFGFELHHVIPRYYEDGEDALVLVARLGDRRMNT